MPRSRREQAVFRVHEMLEWKYGDKSDHYDFSKKIVDYLLDKDVMRFPLLATPNEQS